MRPRYSNDYLARIYGAESVFDLWQVLSTLERDVPLPEKSWLFCRLVEWMSASRSGVWTYYEATNQALQSQISAAVQRCPQLCAMAEHYDLGMRTWISQEEIARVDEWLDSHERELHASLMEAAREEQSLITKLNGEPAAAPNSRPPSELSASPDIQTPDPLRSSSSGGCG